MLGCCHYAELFTKHTYLHWYYYAISHNKVTCEGKCAVVLWIRAQSIDCTTVKPQIYAPGTKHCQLAYSCTINFRYSQVSDDGKVYFGLYLNQKYTFYVDRWLDVGVYLLVNSLMFYIVTVTLIVYALRRQIGWQQLITWSELLLGCCARLVTVLSWATMASFLNQGLGLLRQYLVLVRLLSSRIL